MTKKKRNSLDPSKTTKQRRQYIDYDYSSKLNDEEREFLATFTDEYYGGSFKRNPAYILENGAFIQISENKNKSKNRDLRKIKHITKYYKNEAGELEANEDLKYVAEVIHKDIQQKKDLWKANDRRNEDVISRGFIRDNADNTLHLDILGIQQAFNLEDMDTIKDDILQGLDILEIEYNPDINTDDLVKLISKLRNKTRVELYDLVMDII